MKQFETIYSTDAKGTTREWTIQVSTTETHSTITTRYGIKGGKLIEKNEIISSGKNLGKSNQTTHYAQALAEAESKYTKKRDLEYKNSNVKEFSVMLAKNYDDHKKNIKFPCFSQPKLDGYRAIYDKSDGTLVSRKNKPFPILEKHTGLMNELKQLPDFVYDGELYVHHNPDVPFETLGILRKKKISEKDIDTLCKIEYHIYDIINGDQCKARQEVLQKIKKYRFVKIVPTRICNSEQEITQCHSEFLSQHYEGTMVRNMSSKYIGFRSSDLLKYKDFQDDEFTIIGFECELYDDIPLVIWKISISDSIVCDVRPKGTVQEREYLYKNADSFIGKRIWIKYFGYTEKGSLRFPSTQRNTYTSYIRDIIE